jgi:hypothetical protein
MEKSILPKYSKVIYRFNEETKYYLQSEIEVKETLINRLPKEIRLASAKAGNVTPNASRLLLSRECNNGRYQFFTGLQETCFTDWHLGNDYEYYIGQKIISIILFHFLNDGKKLEVYYFHHYDKPNSIYRVRFANAIIPQLKIPVNIKIL